MKSLSQSQSQSLSLKPEHIIAFEWIGLDIKVVSSPNRSEIGIKGKVVDETINTFVLDTGVNNSLKTVAKCGRTFNVKFMEKNMNVSGNYLRYRPEERIKKGILLLKKIKG